MTQYGNIIVYENFIIDASIICQCHVYGSVFYYTIKSNGFSSHSISCLSGKDALDLQLKVFEIMKNVANNKPNT